MPGFTNKSELQISLELVNSGVGAIAAEPSNSVLLKASVRNKSGAPVKFVNVNFSLDKSLGALSIKSSRTDKYGESIFKYSPPDFSEMKDSEKNIEVSVFITNTDKSAKVVLQLTPVPVVFIHGYLSDANAFKEMRNYLLSNGIEGNGLSYASIKGVVAAADELDNFLMQQKRYYLSKGIQVNKFDVVAHSLGGLVCRYYSSSSLYPRRGNLRKIVFLSVPHQGSPWATLGLAYNDNQGVRDLIPDSELFLKIFPAQTNKGLNRSIQTGNIAIKNDEVVSPESASIEEWGISTEFFDTGAGGFNVETFLKGNIVEAKNHNSVLVSIPVFTRVREMLQGNLPYPKKK